MVGKADLLLNFMVESNGERIRSKNTQPLSTPKFNRNRPFYLNMAFNRIFIIFLMSFSSYIHIMDKVKTVEESVSWLMKIVKEVDKVSILMILGKWLKM